LGELQLFAFSILSFYFNSIRKKIESSFGLAFMLLSSALGVFLCILVFEMMNSSISNDPSRSIYFMAFAAVIFVKISVPHILGQRITSKCCELTDALYQKPWYDYNMLQRKYLLMVMTYNQEEMRINVMGFYDLDLHNLGMVS
jgi:glucan phosphoethanolaminetransferase (alkaline phosphatase superfamily)